MITPHDNTFKLFLWAFMQQIIDQMILSSDQHAVALQKQNAKY
jgi:hypothetical protein